jgi:hypothetical protein
LSMLLLNAVVAAVVEVEVEIVHRST